MKGERVMKMVGVLIVVAAVVLVVLYFTGVLGPKKAPAAAHAKTPGTRDMYGPGGTYNPDTPKPHLLG